MIENQPLNLDTLVADLLKAWPQLIPIFLQHQMACVGCSMSSFETLREAAQIYRIEPQIFMDELCAGISCQP